MHHDINALLVSSYYGGIHFVLSIYNTRPWILFIDDFVKTVTENSKRIKLDKGKKNIVKFRNS